MGDHKERADKWLESNVGHHPHCKLYEVRDGGDPCNLSSLKDSLEAQFREVERETAIQDAMVVAESDALVLQHEARLARIVKAADDVRDTLRAIESPDQSLLREATATGDPARIIQRLTEIMGIMRGMAASALAAYDAETKGIER